MLGPVPIRERAALKVEDEGLCRLVDRVRAKVADASLHNSFVLVRSSLLTVVGPELRVPTSWFFKVLPAWPTALPASKTTPSHRNAKAVNASVVRRFIVLIFYGPFFGIL